VGFMKALKLARLLILILLLVVIGVLVYSSVTGWFTVAVVKGRSMLPTLREGDIVFITRVDPGEIKIGDVIVYKSPSNSLVIHRVISIVNEDGDYYYVTKGDNNPGPDTWNFISGKGIPYNRVIGRVIEVNRCIIKIPYIGEITLLLRRES